MCGMTSSSLLSFGENTVGLPSSSEAHLPPSLVIFVVLLSNHPSSPPLSNVRSAPASVWLWGKKSGLLVPLRTTYTEHISSPVAHPTPTPSLLPYHVGTLERLRLHACTFLLIWSCVRLFVLPALPFSWGRVSLFFIYGWSILCSPPAFWQPRRREILMTTSFRAPLEGLAEPSTSRRGRTKSNYSSD